MGIASPQGGTTKLDGSPHPGSWAQQPGTYTFYVPDGWAVGRVWAKSGCSGGGAGSTCLVGDCPGGCDGVKNGAAGATLAEFTMNAYMNSDSYNISIVDGYNFPMQITATAGCPTASCGTTQDLLEVCDPSLIFPKGSDKIYSCNSACGNAIQFQDGTSGQLVSADIADSPSCCVKNGVAVDHKDCPNTYIRKFPAHKPD
uniref:Thaumatin-like protein n=1 Tax=Kwoniella dejecticola CBS 10117 TaxID=1296121 RepID=A0A1A5ZUH4_9TREE|nr:uncharacterized protein I303_08228 [Kwoniella dejecticola CBS 10117]OBR81458.1 hypothetical protein I303_08228 [Kwoniella dejecticola CBS 10117]